MQKPLVCYFCVFFSIGRANSRSPQPEVATGVSLGHLEADKPKPGDVCSG